MAALCSEVWQNRNRTSLRAFVNAYLLDIASICLSAGRRGAWRVQLARGLEVGYPRCDYDSGVEVES